jgi:hypothetical protein
LLGSLFSLRLTIDGLGGGQMKIVALAPPRPLFKIDTISKVFFRKSADFHGKNFPESRRKS